MYLPVMYYPLHEDQRSTGFLMPKYGTSTLPRRGIEQRVFLGNRTEPGRHVLPRLVYEDRHRRGRGIPLSQRRVVERPGPLLSPRTRKPPCSSRTARPSTLPAQTSYVMNASVNQSLGRRLRAQGNVEYFSDVTTQQLYQQDTYRRSLSRRVISGGLTGVFGPATLGGYYSRSEQFSDTRQFHGVRVDAADHGEHRTVQAVRDAHLCVVEHRVHLPAQSASAGRNRHV